MLDSPRSSFRRAITILGLFAQGFGGGCYASRSVVDADGGADAALHDASIDAAAPRDGGADSHIADASDADLADFDVPHDAGSDPDASRPDDLGISPLDAGLSDLPAFCFPRALDAVRLEITTEPMLIALEGLYLHRFYAEAGQWLGAGPAKWLSSALIPCVPRLSHRGDVVLESATCSLGVSRLEHAGAVLELPSTRAVMTTDTAGGGNVAIVSSVVYRYNGRSWILELDLAATVATEGTLRAVAHESEAGLLLGIGRSLFRSTGPLTVPTRVLDVVSEITSVAHQPGDSTTLVGTSAGTIHVVRSDALVSEFEADGSIEEILTVTPETFLIRTRSSVYRFAGDALSTVYTTAVGDRVDDVALHADKVYAVVVRSQPANDCDRVHFIPL